MAFGGTNPLLLKKAAAADYVVTKSLRFNDGDTPSLSRTPSVAGNRKTFTFSCWFKLSKVVGSSSAYMFSAGTSGERFGIMIRDDVLRVDGNGGIYLTSANKIRDLSGWMHICIEIDTTQSTSTERIKLYINGAEATYNTYTPPGQDASLQVNDTVLHLVGEDAETGGNNFDGYLADVNFIDGIALDAASFGEEDATTGQWKPKAFSGTYGDNGFHLDFEDDTAIGNDVSGEGNDFTATNLAASDVVNDTPTDNYAVLNPLVITHSGVGYDTFSEGNTKVVTDGGGRPIIPSTIFMPPNSGTYYAEFTLSAGAAMYGIARSDVPNADDCTTSSKIWGYESNAGTQYKVNSGSYVSLGTAPSYPVKNGVSYNTATGEVKFFVGGSDIGGYTGLSTDYSYGFFVGDGSTSVSTTITAHFDSDDWDNTPSGVKQLSTGNLPTPTIAKPSEYFNTVLYAGNSPSDNDITTVGFQADLTWIKCRNLSAHDHALYDSVRGATKQLQSNTTNTESTVSEGLKSWDGDGFTVGSNGDANDGVGTLVAWNWLAGTSPSTSHTYELRLDLTTSLGGGWGDSGSYDTPRLKVYEDRGSGNVFLGYATVTSSDDYSASYVINTNNKLAIEIVWEYDDSDEGMNAGDPSYPAGTLKDGSTTMATWVEGTPDVTDGATFIAKTSGQTASGTGTLVTWAGGATGSSYNADAGFSIVTYTGDDYDGAGTEQTINHNLGVAPEMVIVKGRTDENGMTVGWGVYHKDLTVDNLLYLNTNDEEYPMTTMPITSITDASVGFLDDYGSGFNYGGDASASADDYVAYFFASVEGYSKMGSYAGNSLADGPFVYCGFTPEFILIKNTGGSYGWFVWDTVRNTGQPLTDYLYADTSDAEATDGDYIIDVVSNGFQPRAESSGMNNTSYNYIYYAVAKNPFKYANAR